MVVVYTLPGNSSFDADVSLLLLAVILAAAIGTGVLFAVSLVAYARRRRTQYLFISVAIGALWLRSVLGAGTVLGYLSMPLHHLVEHTLDLFIAITVLYAVFVHAPGAVADANDRE